MILLDALASAILGKVIHEGVLRIRESGEDPYKKALEILLGELESEGYQKEITECIRNSLLGEDLVSCNSHSYTIFYEKCLATYKRDVREPEPPETDALEKACTYLYGQFKRVFDFIIKEHPMYELYKLLTVITIPSITSESYLDKDCILDDKPDLFRPDPKWIDFEKGYFIERDEKVKLLSKLQRENLHIIYGDPSSGKSHFVRYLGYLFLKEAYEVYILELKKGKIREQFKKDVAVLAERRRCVLIIDDAHLDVNGVDYVLDMVRGKDLILIVSTRPLGSKSDRYPKSTLERIMKDKKVSTELASMEIAPRIVVLYSTLIAKAKGIEVSSNIREKIVLRYGKDLWFLKWAFEAYDGRETLPEDIIRQKIAQERFYRYEYERGRYLYNVGGIFYYISLFSMYEFPVERGFILHKVGDRKADLEKMLSSREFIEKENNRIMLHHSSIGEIYFDTLLSGVYREPDYKREKIEEIFTEYFKMYSWNALELIGVLGSWGYSESDIIRNLVSKIGIGMIREAVDRAGNLRAIGYCVHSITEADSDAGKRLVSSLDLSLLVEKINQEKHLEAIGYCIYLITKADSDVGKRLLPAVVKKINQTHDLEAIEYCIFSITDADPNAGKRLVSTLDLSILVEKINQADDLIAIGDCISSITEADPNVGKRLLPAVVKKINQEKDLEAIGNCIFSITEADPNAGKNLINQIKHKDMDFFKTS